MYTYAKTTIANKQDNTHP